MIVMLPPQPYEALDAKAKAMAVEDTDFIGQCYKEIEEEVDRWVRKNLSPVMSCDLEYEIEPQDDDDYICPISVHTNLSGDIWATEIKDEWVRQHLLPRFGVNRERYFIKGKEFKIPAPIWDALVKVSFGGYDIEVDLYMASEEAYEGDGFTEDIVGAFQDYIEAMCDELREVAEGVIYEQLVAFMAGRLFSPRGIEASEHEEFERPVPLIPGQLTLPWAA